MSVTQDNEMSAPAQERGCHVYAVVPADVQLDLDELTGLDGRPLRLVEAGPVAAVVNDIDLERPPGRRKDLTAYNEVLDAMAEQAPVVPIRFGQVLLDDEQVVAELLLPSADLFVDLLDRVGGRSQFVTRTRYVEGTALRELLVAEPQIAALRERTRDVPEHRSYGDRVRLGELVAQGLERKRTHEAETLLDVFVELADEVKVDLGSDVDDLATYTLLVEDERQEELEERLEELAEAVHERIRVSLLGPMAPYDFVDDV